MSKFTIFYTIIAVFIVGWYTYSTASGTEYFHPSKQKTTEEARKSGYRGTYFIFIHSGGRGGK
jgi:hypothetical protein